MLTVHPHVAQPAPSWQILHADCLAFLQSLPTASIDIITTDPAYEGLNKWLNIRKSRITGQHYSSQHRDSGGSSDDWFCGYPEDDDVSYQRLFAECQRVLNPQTGHIFLMVDSFSLVTLAPLFRSWFDLKNIIVWDKTSIGMGYYFRRQHEFILFGTNGNRRKLRHRNISDIWQVKRVRKPLYKTQKPVALFSKMLHASAGTAGYTVCDPFLGSGSSAIAALQHGCHFVGCDSSVRAVAISQQRLRHYQHTGLDPYEHGS